MFIVIGRYPKCLNSPSKTFAMSSINIKDPLFIRILYPCKPGVTKALIWASATSLTSTEGRYTFGRPGIRRRIIFTSPSIVPDCSLIKVGPKTELGWRVTISKPWPSVESHLWRSIKYLITASCASLLLVY
jgi:hypothetical protein